MQPISNSKFSGTSCWNQQIGFFWFFFLGGGCSQFIIYFPINVSYLIETLGGGLYLLTAIFILPNSMLYCPILNHFHLDAAIAIDWIITFKNRSGSIVNCLEAQTNRFLRLYINMSGAICWASVNIKHQYSRERSEQHFLFWFFDYHIIM